MKGFMTFVGCPSPSLWHSVCYSMCYVVCGRVFVHITAFTFNVHAYMYSIRTVHAKDYVRISAYACRMHFTALCGSRYRCPWKSLRVSANISAYEYVYTFYCSVNVRGLYYGTCVRTYVHR